ncbi:class I SAM-dependent methyltransferase [Patescibacteria group bacterium]
MKDFKAKIWDQRNTSGGEPYKKHLLDPLILKLIQPIKNKVVLDQGCGNGHLAVKIAKYHPKKIILLDLYPENLKIAKKNLKNISCPSQFIQTDLNQTIKIKSNTIDLVVSSMTLIELKNINKVIKQTYRILKPNGQYLITTVHPAFSLKKYLQQKYTKEKNQKIIPVRHYFDNRKSQYVFGLDSQHKNFTAPHYSHTIEDYIKSLLKTGFKITAILEPQINKRLIKNAPRFKTDIDCPISLIIKATK